MDRLKEMFPGKVSPIIRENVSLAEAPGRGRPVILTARISKGADDYRLVSLWLDEQIGFELDDDTGLSYNDVFKPIENAGSL
jgi:cellulose biosynthesis protein BcsQ